MFSWGHGKPQDSLGSKLPTCTLPHAHLTERRDWDSEMWHMVFRTFSSSEESDPVKDLHTLSRLCRHWLRPDLHTMEQILDKLVIEQFLISMSPELQVLVKESAVETCKDLENLLRKNEKPKKWTIVTIEGKMFLEKKSDVQTEEAQVSDMDHTWDLSMTPQSCESQMEIHPEDSQEVNQELENQSGISEMSSGQGEKVLLPETIPKKGDLEGLSPTQMLEEDLMQDKETTVLTSPEPQLLRGPEDSVGEKNPQEEICMENVDADVPSTHVSETDVLTQRGKKRSWKSRGPSKGKRDNTSIPQDVPQEGAISLDKGKFSGTPKSNSVRAPSTGEPTGRRDGKGATKRALYKCKDCRKSFSYESQLTLHQRTHTGERPFKCTQCSKGFMQSSDLRVHQRIHTGEKPYCCNFCKMTFTHESTLRGHQRVHTKERPYLCKVCHKSFSHRGNLNVHLRIHSDKKPYLCHECNQAFRQLGTFKRHQNTHINRTPQ